MRDTWGSFKGLHTWTNLSPYAYCTECFRTRHETQTVKALFRCPGHYVKLDECGQPEPEPKPTVVDLMAALEKSLAAAAERGRTK